jgi:hypothetical protein
LVGFVAAHGDAFELLEFAEEVFDQVTPLVDFRVDDEWLCAPRASVGLPKQWGCIFARWASANTKRSIQSLNHVKLNP